MRLTVSSFFIIPYFLLSMTSAIVAMIMHIAHIAANTLTHIMLGRNTNHHEQAITPVIFNANNTTVRKFNNFILFKPLLQYFDPPLTTNMFQRTI